MPNHRLAKIIPFEIPGQEPVTEERAFDDRLRDALHAALHRIDTEPIGGIFLVVLDAQGMTIQRDNIVYRHRHR